MTMLVAQVAVATSIAPNDLLDTPPDVFWAIVAVLKEHRRREARVIDPIQRDSQLDGAQALGAHAARGTAAQLKM